MRVILFSVAILAAACSAKQVLIQPGGNLQQISRDVQLEVRGEGVDPMIVSDLTRYLKGNLIIAGFNVDSGTADALRLLVDVKRFDAGNAALRVTVGFGAGRGSLLYAARYLDAQGKVLAEMDGQERFTGGEPHFNMEYGQFATLGGAEKVQEVLVREAAKHIIELGLGKSKAPEKTKARKS